jgi:uncharacterized membrane protein (Fun14 family)
MVVDISSVGTVVGGRLFGGLLLRYTIKKLVKLMAVVVGLFIVGLVYLQYQQGAYFDSEKIERVVTPAFGNVGSQIVTSQDISSFAMTNFGIPLTSGMSAGFAVGFMKG